MTDFGDEVGRDVEQSMKVVTGLIAIKILQRFLTDMRKGNYQEYNGHVYSDRSEDKPNYIIEPYDDGDFEVFFDNEEDAKKAADILEKYNIEENPDFDSITVNNSDIKDITESLDKVGFNEVGKHERIMKIREKTVCIQNCNTLEARDAVIEMLKKNGIAAEAVGKSVRYYKQDIPKIEKVVDEYIKSHDGMDLDTRTAVNEIDTPSEKGQVSWRNDIAEKVYEARISSTDENEFIKACESRGVRVTNAKDGELMFVHPSGDHLKIRGDTLGKDYTHDSFKEKPMKLDREAKDMRTAAKILNESERSKNIDRDIPTFQNLSK